MTEALGPVTADTLLDVYRVTDKEKLRALVRQMAERLVPASLRQTTA